MIDERMKVEGASTMFLNYVIKLCLHYQVIPIKNKLSYVENTVESATARASTSGVMTVGSPASQILELRQVSYISRNYSY
jgi:hypothetical protein